MQPRSRPSCLFLCSTSNNNSEVPQELTARARHTKTPDCVTVLRKRLEPSVDVLHSTFFSHQNAQPTHNFSAGQLHLVTGVFTHNVAARRWWGLLMTRSRP